MKTDMLNKARRDITDVVEEVGGLEVDAPTCLTPETDAAEFPIMTWPDREHPMAVRSTLARKLETERNELTGYLCRIKLPLPVSFMSRLADLFPGENVRMKAAGGYLCIYSENVQAMASADTQTPKENGQP